MPPLDDVTTGVKHPSDVLRINSSSKMRVAIVLAVMTGLGNLLERRNGQEGSIEPEQTGLQSRKVPTLLKMPKTVLFS